MQWHARLPAPRLQAALLRWVLSTVRGGVRPLAAVRQPQMPGALPLRALQVSADRVLWHSRLYLQPGIGCQGDWQADPLSFAHLPGMPMQALPTDAGGGLCVWLCALHAAVWC